jgi:hypothetical protein
MNRGVDTAAPATAGPTRVFSVPNPYPLTFAGLLAALGPQAINFGISVGGARPC